MRVPASLLLVEYDRPRLAGQPHALLDLIYGSFKYFNYDAFCLWWTQGDRE